MATGSSVSPKSWNSFQDSLSSLPSETPTFVGSQSTPMSMSMASPIPDFSESSVSSSSPLPSTSQSVGYQVPFSSSRGYQSATGSMRSPSMSRSGSTSNYSDSTGSQSNMGSQSMRGQRRSTTAYNDSGMGFEENMNSMSGSTSPSYGSFGSSSPSSSYRSFSSPSSSVPRGSSSFASQRSFGSMESGRPRSSYSSSWSSGERNLHQEKLLEKGYMTKESFNLGNVVTLDLVSDKYHHKALIVCPNKAMKTVMPADSEHTEHMFPLDVAKAARLLKEVKKHDASILLVKGNHYWHVPTDKVENGITSLKVDHYMGDKYVPDGIYVVFNKIPEEAAFIMESKLTQGFFADEIAYNFKKVAAEAMNSQKKVAGTILKMTRTDLKTLPQEKVNELLRLLNDAVTRFESVVQNANTNMLVEEVGKILAPVPK